MRHHPTRRDAIATLLASSAFATQSIDPASSQRVFEAVWEGVRDQFYDPNTRGVNWARIRIEFAPRVQACTSPDQLLSILREMLGRLHNSHIFLYSRAEWDLRQNILPFCFDHVESRTFIRQQIVSKLPEISTRFDFGDEILSVDGTDAAKPQPLTLARLQEVRGNPLFGPEDSLAKVQVNRRHETVSLAAKRIKRPSGLQNVTLDNIGPLPLLRFLTLDSNEIPVADFRPIWEEACSSYGLILDLRNCVGGDSEVINFLAGGLLGGGKPLFQQISRHSFGHPSPVPRSDFDVPRPKGRVAVLVNANTESAPEALAAICQEYKCARIIGERTAGAFNGWTVAIPLPDHFARFALPYTRGVSPMGREYEGIGITPDVVVQNAARDVESGLDRVLEGALSFLID